MGRGGAFSFLSKKCYNGQKHGPYKMMLDKMMLEIGRTSTTPPQLCAGTSDFCKVHLRVIYSHWSLTARC